MFFASLYIDLGLHKWLGGKEFTCNAGDMGLRPGSGTSPGEGNGYPLQYSCLENPTTEEAGRQQSKGSQRNGQDLVMRQQWHVVCSPSHHWRQLGASLGLEPEWPGPCLDLPPLGVWPLTVCPKRETEAPSLKTELESPRISLYCICLVKRVYRASWGKGGNGFYLLIESSIAHRKGWIFLGGGQGACGMWDLSSWPRMEPILPALGAGSFNHWTSREVPGRERIDGGSPWKLSPTYVYNLLLKLGVLFAVLAGGGPSELLKFINLFKR